MRTRRVKDDDRYSNQFGWCLENSTEREVLVKFVKQELGCKSLPTKRFRLVPEGTDNREKKDKVRHNINTL